MRALNKLPQCPNITRRFNAIKTLNISSNNIRAYGATILSEVLLQGDCDLVDLDLSNNAIADDGAQALAKALVSPTTRLQTLSVRNNGIHDLGFECICIALEQNDTLTHTDVSVNHTTSRSRKLLADVLRRNKSLTSLSCENLPCLDNDGEYNKIFGCDDRNTIWSGYTCCHATFFHTPALTTDPCLSGMAILSEVLEHNVTLTSLDVGNAPVRRHEVGLGHAGAVSLSKAIARTKVATRSICSPTDVKNTCDCVQVLARVSLRGQSVGSRGAEALANGIAKNVKTLVTIDISNNRFD